MRRQLDLPLNASFAEVVELIKSRCNLLDRIVLQYREPKRGRAPPIALDGDSDMKYLKSAIEKNPKGTFIVIAQVSLRLYRRGWRPPRPCPAVADPATTPRSARTMPRHGRPAGLEAGVAAADQQWRTSHPGTGCRATSRHRMPTMSRPVQAYVTGRASRC